jgi:hypothetical protein
MFKRYVYTEGLTSLIGSNNKILINTKGQIKDIDGNDLPSNEDHDHHKTVTCSGWDGYRTYRVIDLVAIQYKNLFIPQEDFNEIVAFVIDGDKGNTHANNVGYRFKNKVLRYKHLEGFYYIPGITALAVNKEGVIVSVNTNEVKKFYIHSGCEKRNIRGGYHNAHVNIKGFGRISISRHRALCLTFKDFPNNVDSLTVNHKDGNGANDALDNLEWTTRSQNNRHAYINDLKKQNKRVLVRNILTSEVTEYYSISECARALGHASDESIRGRIYNSTFGQVFQDGTQIKLKEDPRGWVDVINPTEVILNNQQKIRITVRDCRDLSLKSYESVSVAAENIGILPGTILARLKSDNRGPLFGYQFKKEYDLRPFPNFTPSDLALSYTRNQPLTVNAENLLTGEERTLPSLREVKRLFGERAHHGLRNEKQPLLDSGWRFKLSHEEWLDSSDFDEQRYKLQSEIMCREESTGKIIISDNANSLSRLLSMDPKFIRKAAFTRGNQILNGYRFRLGFTTEAWPQTQLNT